MNSKEHHCDELKNQWFCFVYNMIFTTHANRIIENFISDVVDA